MNYTTFLPNGEVRYYKEKDLAGLDFEFALPYYGLEFAHYGFIAANIYVYVKDRSYAFAKTLNGFVLIKDKEGRFEPSDLDLPRVAEKFETNRFYTVLGRRLYEFTSGEYPTIEIEVKDIDETSIKDMMEYLTDYYDLMQLALEKQDKEGGAAINADSIPEIPMDSFITGKSGHVLSEYGLPYTINIPVYDRKIVIEKNKITISALK